MKKIGFLVYFMFLVNLAFSVDLWNGFTTEMSKEEVIQHAHSTLSVVRSVKEDDSQFYDGWKDDKKYPKVQRVCIYSPLPAYSQSDWCSNIFGNILAYFFNDKLICIRIIWTANENDALNRAKTQYGNPNNTFKVDSFFSVYDAYYWRLTEKDFVIDRGSYYFIDRVTRLTWVDEQNRIEAQQRADAEARRRSATDSITF